MKDEEMAEQYAQNLEKELMKEYEEHSEYGQTAYLATIPTPHAKQAFIAGLKAGRPQWHDLRKDPNDLPKEVGNYLVCYIDTMLNRNVFMLEFVDFLEDSHWIDETSHEIEKFDEGVIAWCEIPTFDKE